MTEARPAPTGPFKPGGNVILCADDYALSDGVSSGIEELARAGRLTATSALVTLPTWPKHAPRLARLRPTIAIGLHLNLTLGAPLGPMPGLAPLGRLPGLDKFVRLALSRRLDVDEIATEFERQLARFELATGFAPDFVDGHQHAHALPQVRTALSRALPRRFPDGRVNGQQVLVRDPGDHASAILRRGASPAKALFIAGLTRGFAVPLTAAGFVTNIGFSGVSSFDVKAPFGTELARFFAVPGRRHLVMCHPGYSDAALAALDPHTARRRQELDAIMAADGLVEAIWHIDRRREHGQPMWPDTAARSGAAP